ncbi:FAT domain-containing protein [Piptocephalis cylindrospora]|uniref:FAT domain-containing protein n=1 Tax=Piptocephalis cylindrospora TaxID=1907219 RepID=A0A4P9Y9W1_9FUNG|nr:FAT domain-containing protein [Piptocephalis cylindrospora]|eukprot:RKP14820.1 FAT domain-containing protein [Piptocephalis cylindrospora]
MAGKWAEAQAEWETAQIHARAAGTADPRLRPTEAALWETRWTACTGELQQWDLLADVARHDMSASLTVKAAWRLGLGGFGSGNADGTEERDGLRAALLSVPETSQTCAMEATMHLAELLSQREDPHNPREEARAAYHRACERSVHLALSEWWALPHNRVGKGHLGALRGLQQLVEVQEAGRLTRTLLDVGVGGFEERVQELRPILTSWRERLPLEWEPVGKVWSDLMAWRQRMYGLMNKVLLPLVPLLSAADTSANSLAYRGYHETAWMVNRFARVARKHGLREVCSAQLARIYTLPNIEISEAFVKLREQARCHFRGGGWADVASGLEVISHTNLMYFTPRQKAEFFALKGSFMDKLGLPVEGVAATMSQATKLDVGHAKAWVAWGRFNDRLSGLPDISDTERTTHAVRALECYMQATIIQREAKARRYIARILWLLGMDVSANGEVGKAFETFTEDIPIWYWLTFLPQLLVSLGYREAKQVRLILIKMSKAFPQALHYHLRTAREELAWMRHGGGRRQGGGADASGRRPQDGGLDVGGLREALKEKGESGEKEEAPKKKEVEAEKKEESESGRPEGSQLPQPPQPPPPVFRTALDHVEEVMSMLKTAFPLLALTVETMSGQLVSRLKPSSEEDLYRLICALLYDATQHLAMRLSSGGKDLTLPSPTIAHIRRFADSMARGSLRDAFIRAFVPGGGASTQGEVHSGDVSYCGHLPTHVVRLRRWKREFERYLDAQPTFIPLETLSTYLADFEHQRFEDVEIPGQYLLLRDASTHFVKLERFEPIVEVIRDAGACSRRLRVRGQDGSVHRLLLQHPTPRVVRREERMQQFMRLMNDLLARRWPARSMALAFHLPLLIPLSPAVRIIMEPLGPYRSLLEIAEEEAGRRGVDRDAAVRHFLSGLDEAVGLLPASTLMSPSKLAGVVRGIRVDLMSQILSSPLSPSTTLSRWVERRMRSPTDLWLYRRRFTEHLAIASFTTYLLGLGYRYPSRMRISLDTGAIHCLESHPTLPTFSSADPVPFRLSPTLQDFCTPVGIEGPFLQAMMSMGQSMTQPEDEFLDVFAVFVRDEMVAWSYPGRAGGSSTSMSEEGSGGTKEGGGVTSQASATTETTTSSSPTSPAPPITQPVLDLIAQATHPHHLAQMDPNWAPWL